MKELDLSAINARMIETPTGETRVIPLSVAKSFDQLRQENTDKLYHKNPEWYALRGRENRMPNQFSSKDQDMPPEATELPTTYVLTENELDSAEVEQLTARGITLPVEIEPVDKVEFYTEADDLKSELVDTRSKIFPYNIAEGDKTTKG